MLWFMVMAKALDRISLFTKNQFIIAKFNNQLYRANFLIVRHDNVTKYRLKVFFVKEHSSSIYLFVIQSLLLFFIIFWPIN